MAALWILLAAVVIVVAFVAIGRVRARANEAALRDAIRAYAEERGATVAFDDQGMAVKGPLGEGREKLTALRVMCTPEKRALWNTSIGFVLRKYIPDAFEEAFAKAARERLAKALPEIEALSDGDLRDGLRVRVFSKRTSAEGLATCAKPIGERFEARVVLEGFDLAGLPVSARARLPEDDDALHQAALAATTADEPTSAGRQIEGHAWLCVPQRIFGPEPAVLACAGTSLRWIPAREGTAASALAALAGHAQEDGPMKGAMFAWDGEALHDVGVTVHTIVGPNAPDFTIRLPPPLAARMGLELGAEGTVGVRR